MLEICQSLFSALGKKPVRYCHWKSNEHLAEGLAGKTDLDLLIHREDREAFEALLQKMDFRPLRDAPGREIPGIVHFLGFDRPSGRLVHLHVHYALVLGERQIKNHALPIEHVLLAHTTTREGVAVPCGGLEALVLILRANMKLEWPMLAAFALRLRSSPFPAAIAAELHHLLAEFDPAQFQSFVTESGLGLDAGRLLHFVRAFQEGRLTPAAVWTTRRHVFKALKPFRRTTGMAYAARLAAARLRYAKLTRRFLPPPKKYLARKGKVIAIVGADGSGKSTIAAALQKWLAWKLDARAFYFGIPKGARFRAPALAVRLIRRLARMAPGPARPPLESFAVRLSALRWIAVAKERYRLFAVCRDLADKGGVAVCDRYPLPQFREMAQPMDGPRIESESGNAAGELGMREAEYYAAIGFPDRLIVLNTSFEELRRRRSDLPEASHREKAEAVNALRPDNLCRVVDANRPLEAVLLDVKAAVWEGLA